MSTGPNESILTKFRPQVATWFHEVFKAPTSVQEEAWKAISAGENALVVAPTGSGKTLAAFLWAINTLVNADGQTALGLNTGRGRSQLSPKERDGSGVKVLYISPLKALGVDVERNLRAPLVGINRVAERMGLPTSDISVAVRSGDTPSSERSRQVRKPPDVLITTPESAYLMLTSKASAILKDVDTVIIDEIHALAGTKRGAHLALTLERLDRIAEKPIQRIGLSATVRPLETVAAFLGGDRPVEIINPPLEKKWDINVHVGVEDMSDLPIQEPGSTIGEVTYDDPLGLASPLTDEDEDAEPGTELAPLSPLLGQESALPSQGSIWPSIEEALYEEIMSHRSTLVFVNSRRSAERLTSRINEIYAERNDPESLSAETRRPPSQLGKFTDVAGQAPAIIARAHHGSVSKDERATTEVMLKEGDLKAVIATSSLELGIDMGAVELVVQVESPPSVASGLQRIGRAGHVVGAVSHGSLYPKHRSDLVQTAVTVGRMRDGLIEELHVPTNALDILVQQTVAAVALEDINVDEWYATVTRAYPYRNLAREVFDAVIDLASGIYPSTDFADLKPRVNFDRTTGILSGRPGAQRVAVTSGGTIPDRGMFGVFLIGGEEGARRVGELDEEMVYESRTGDIFTLGASSWRIEEITRDQVLVSPAPGHTGRLPFWNGDGLGRPAELGRAVGAFHREVAADASVLDGRGLDENSRNNIVQYLAEQKEATGVIPDEKTLVLERFRDELGDWRVVLHTPYGRGVNAAWALAVGARISERTGIDAQPVSSDDGIVLRLPETDEVPGADVFLFDPDEIEDIVTQQVGNSALFASRFRENAARALLLPRKNPGKRAPLWQQRQRAAQLLDVARKYPSFPIILETVRECLRDVYDLPELKNLAQELALHRVRIAEVTTEQPSPFAASLLFNYTGAFMYEGDSPLAEKRAAALALDPALLAKLLGTVELRELLDQEIIAETDARLRRVAPDRRARSLEEFADTLRIVGPVPVAELASYLSPEFMRELGVDPDALQVPVFPENAANELSFDDAALDSQSVEWAELLGNKIADSEVLRTRVMRVRIAGEEHLAQQVDAALLRDGLGVPVPPGTPAQVATIPDAFEQILSRWVRTRGPFVARDLAQATGISMGMAHSSISSLVKEGKLVQGQYRRGIEEDEFVAPEVLSIIRSRSLAAARAQTRAVSQSAFARFLPDWQQIAPVGEKPALMGADGVYTVCEQLAGVRLPASAWENLIFPQRVRNYRSLDLDEITTQGEVKIVGAGTAGSADPWVKLLPTDYAAELTAIPEEHSLSDLQEEIITILSRGGGFLFGDIVREITGDASASERAVSGSQIRDAMWELFDLGLISPDGFAPIRARLAGIGTAGKSAHRAKRTPARSKLRMGRTSFAQAQRAAQPPDMLGRWSLTVPADHNATARSVAHGEAWLDRYGVVTKGSVVAEDVVGGFALAYKVLSQFEDAGKAMRGYIIEGLGAAQFSTPAVIDRLRGHADSDDVEGWPSGTKEPTVYVMAACDPANPYGAALPWPIKGLSRSAGAIVVLIDGLLAAHLTRGGKNMTLAKPPAGVSQEELISLVMKALMDLVATGRSSKFVVVNINGESVLTNDLLPLFRAAGAGITPRGMKIDGHAPAPRTATPCRTRAAWADNSSEDNSDPAAIWDSPQRYGRGQRGSGFKSGGFYRR